MEMNNKPKIMSSTLIHPPLADEFGETKSPAPVCWAGGFSDAGIFAYRANDIYLLLDASPFIGAS
jgi:hypothetical protein